MRAYTRPATRSHPSHWLEGDDAVNIQRGSILRDVRVGHAVGELSESGSRKLEVLSRRNTSPEEGEVKRASATVSSERVVVKRIVTA